MKAARLLKHIALYPVLRRYAHKKDIPPNDRQFQPLLLSFGLWGNWYVPRGPGGLLTVTGEEMPFHTAHLITHGTVVGQRDIEAAAGTLFYEGWRESMIAAINTRLGLQ